MFQENPCTPQKVPNNGYFGSTALAVYDSQKGIRALQRVAGGSSLFRGLKTT